MFFLVANYGIEPFLHPIPAVVCCPLHQMTNPCYTITTLYGCICNSLYVIAYLNMALYSLFSSFGSNQTRTGFQQTQGLKMLLKLHQLPYKVARLSEPPSAIPLCVLLDHSQIKPLYTRVHLSQVLVQATLSLETFYQQGRLS